MRQPEPPSDSTGGLDPALSSSTPVEAGASFGRYRDLRFVGAGGMAAVYEAHDPTLGRSVALKLLRGDDPQLAERLLLEARAQARIQHEHVCRIYEAGVQDGRHYIAMQYVQGVTLKELHASLTLELKLKLIQDVAEAVHAAHRVGLVHRDLKPSNVMLERTEDGRWFPYVMDFGLAREASAPGLTATGIVLGTPWYMSPEQARGESRTLDRRSDVYSLGATLYELLGQRPPFDGTSSLEVLMKVLSEEPVPLGQRDPSIPRDVQTIVMKCMEKEPARRYDSARALSEDVGRYLEGEPIQARPTSLYQRLYKRALKNKAVTATAAVALVLVLAFAALGLRARASARRQAELAADFARIVEDVGWIMRVAHMAPLHDIRREKGRVSARLAQIEERMKTAGSPARGPGEYALGRGQLVLGDPEAARRHLESAWSAGFRTPEVAYALGLALGELYRRELELADSIGSRELREARRQEIQAQYRDPAVAHLRRAAGTDVAAPEYVTGLMAFYEKRFPEALSRAEVARARVPWLYEASLLEGDVHSAESRQAQETGDPAGAAKAVEAAEAAYGAAADVARSDPAALEGLCQMGLQRMEAVLWSRGELAPLHDDASRRCETALIVDPDRAEVHAKLANIHRYWANHILLQGADPLAALSLAADQAQRAVDLDPRSQRGVGNLGIIYRLRAEYEKDHGIDPAPSLQRAFQGLEKAVELSGNSPGALNDLGNAYVTRAEEDRSRDPRADLERAVSCYDRALERTPNFAYAHGNRATAFLDRARYEADHGLDPSASLTEALASLERASALMPRSEGVFVLMAQTEAAKARFLERKGEDPGPTLSAGRKRIEAAARVNPAPGPDVHIVAGELGLVAARFEMEAGRSPQALLDEARNRFRKAAAADPKLAQASLRLGEAGALEARGQLEAHRDPGAALARATRALDDAIRKDPKNAEAHVAQAEVERQLAAWRISRGKSAGAILDAGLQWADRALALRPSLADALAVKGGLLALKADAAPEAAERRDLARRAEDALSQALAQNAHLAREWEPERNRARSIAGLDGNGAPR